MPFLESLFAQDTKKKKQQQQKNNCEVNVITTTLWKHHQKNNCTYASPAIMAEWKVYQVVLFVKPSLKYYSFLLNFLYLEALCLYH